MNWENESVSVTCIMIHSLSGFQHPFFIGIAGSGMSALAQYLNESGKDVSGSDRFFKPGEYNEIREKLEAEGIKCFNQDGEGITSSTDLVVVSSAVEDTVVEVQKAKSLNIPILKRAELLALIAAGRKTIAVGGTSGKSTTAAMLFEILEYAGWHPGIITGAGLLSLMKKGKIGNAKRGTGQWLVIEADESDGSITGYHPEVGVLLNIDKDHKEIEELMEIFKTFKSNCKQFIVNQANPLAKTLSQNRIQDFSTDEKIDTGYVAKDFKQSGFTIQFTIHDLPFTLKTAGMHNMENALAATAVANLLGVDVKTGAEALRNYQGIYRRFQVLGNKNGVWVVDDYAHNPVKCASAIRACQPVAPKIIAWFQPHGYGPTRFLRTEFVKEIGNVLRPQDEIWMSEIFYAGGTTEKTISARDLVQDLKAAGKNAFFVEDRNNFLMSVRPHLTGHCVLLLMGARDPSLEKFAKEIWQDL